MPVRVVCPECGATTTLDDDSPRKAIACRQCGKEVSVPGAKAGGPPPLPPPVPKSAPTPAADSAFEVLDDEEADERPPARRPRDDDEDEDRPRLLARARDEDDEDDDRPARRRAKREDEDEEEEDRPRRPAARGRDDDEEDEEDDAPRRRPAARKGDDDEEDEVEEARPRSARAAVRDEDEEEDEDDSIPRRRADGGYGGKGGRPPRPPEKSRTGLIVAGLLVFVLLGAGGGAAAYFLMKDDDTRLAQGNGNNPPQPDVPDPQRPDPKVPDPKTPDPKTPDPKTPDPKTPDPKQPAAPGLPIRPVAFDGDRKTVPLPGKVADACAGGDGRYLFLHCPDQKKLLVYDVPAAAVIKELATAGADARFAAGAAKLLLLDNAARTIQRYDLLTLEKDKEGPYPFEGAVQDIALGSGAQGPALAVGTAPADAWPVHFLDVDTLGKADVGWGAALPADLPRDVRFRAAANGTRWAGVPGGPNAHGVVVVTREGKKLTAERYGPDKDFGFAALSADGSYLYSRGGPALVHPSLGLGKARDDQGSVLVPAVSSALEVRLDPADGKPDAVKASVGRRAKTPVLTTAENVPRPGGPDDPASPDRLVFYVPEAHALTVLPSGRDKVEVVKLDPLSAADKLSMLISSTAPTWFTPGQTFTYQVRAVWTGAQPTFGPPAGVPGVRGNPAGLVQWDVPADEKAEQVTITVTGHSGGARSTQMVRLFNALAPAPKAPEPKKEPPPKDPKEPPKDPKSPDPKTPAVAGNLAVGAKLVQEAPGKLPITAPELMGDRAEVALPSPIRDACVAGGGRFLVFHCPAARKLAVFDVNSLKVEKAIGVNTDDVLFAAGMEKLLVVYPDEKVVHRYSLATLKFEADAELTVRQRPTAAGMGSATLGPLLLGGIPSQNNASKMALTFIDLDTMKEVPIDKAEGEFKVTFGTAARLRVSADGRALGAWFAQLDPSGLQVAQLDGNTIRGSYQKEAVGHVTPGPDGQTIFTEKGMYTPKGEPTGKRDAAVPAVHGNWYLTLPPNPKGPAGARVVTVWEAGKDAPLAEFDDLPGFNGKRDPFERDTPTLALDRRLYLVPEAKLLVVVPPTANKLIVYRVGAEKK